jgi:hypothetical protein
MPLDLNYCPIGTVHGAASGVAVEPTVGDGYLTRLPGDTV